MKEYTKNYNGFEVEVREDSENYYVDFGTGAGEGDISEIRLDTRSSYG